MKPSPPPKAARSAAAPTSGPVATARPPADRAPSAVPASGPPSGPPLAAASSEVGLASASAAAIPATAPRWFGKRVGRFKLVGLLGVGSMGRVYRAEDTLLNRHVALKVFPQTVKRGDQTIQVGRLVAEARAAAALEHPHAAHIYEVNDAAGVHYIAMELVEGGSLHDLVSATGPLEPRHACQLAAEAAEALAAAHALGIIHRDVKPANLMLSRAGRCKVVDFGLARIDSPADLTQHWQEAVGTPSFIAPEVAGGTPATARSDVYGLAASLWFLIVGRPPFEGNNNTEIIRQHQQTPLPDLRALRPDLPDGLVRLLTAAMSKDPAERPATADLLAKMLRVQTIAPAADGGFAVARAAGEAAAQSTTSVSSTMAPAAAAAPAAAPPSDGVLRIVLPPEPESAHPAVATAASTVPAPSASPVWTWVLRVGAVAAVALLAVVAAIWSTSGKGKSGNSEPTPAAAAQPLPARPAEPPVGATVDLLAVLNPASMAVRGSWRLDGRELVSADDAKPAVLLVPCKVPIEYDYRVEFTARGGAQQVVWHRPPAGGPATEFRLSIGPGEPTAADAATTPADSAEAAVASVRIPVAAGGRHVAEVQVRRNAVRALLDGRAVIEWTTGAATGAAVSAARPADATRLGVAAWQGSVRVHKMELIDRSGGAATP